MKRIVILLTVAFLVMMAGMAQADLVDPSLWDPSTVHVNGGTTYLFSSGTEVHALTNPSTITLNGAGTINDVILVFAVPGESESLATTANGKTATNQGDLTSGQDVYNNVLGLSAFHPDGSQSFANYTGGLTGLPAVDTSATNFDIWTFDKVNSSALTSSSDVSVLFANGVPDGTFVFAYGFGTDGKLYVTPITETGFAGPHPPQVPEPGMLLLFGSGLLGLGFLARKGLRK